MNKTAKFDICYQGDPDLQLIRSFENATAVRLLHHLCNYVNTQVLDGILSAITHMDKCANNYFICIKVLCYAKHSYVC